MNISAPAFGGKRDPEQTLFDAMTHIREAKIAVVVYLDKDGFVNTGWSDGSMLKRLGMLDVAKHQMMIDTDE